MVHTFIKKPRYTVKYDVDDGINEYDESFLQKNCIWTEPLQGVITKHIWEQGVSSIKVKRKKDRRIL